MPSDIRCSGRRSLEKPSREWKAIGRTANEKKTNEQAAIGKLPFGKKARPPGRRVGKSTWEKNEAGNGDLGKKKALRRAPCPAWHGARIWPRAVGLRSYRVCQ